MGWNDHMDDSELSNLPPEAFAQFNEGPFNPDNHWLKHADPDDQAIAMREWFLARFCDPAEETPYNGQEGGYLFIHGGPFDPGDVLPTRFSGIVDDDLIEEIVEELRSLHGDQWAPFEYPEPDDLEYDPRYGLQLQSREEPMRNLKSRLQQAKKLLSLRGDPLSMTLVEKLVFGAAIGALESFLWETMHYWVDSDESVLKSVATKLPALKDEPIKLGDIYVRYEGLKSHVTGYLQNLVWHRWEKVAPLFKLGLDIALPTAKPLEAAMIKRHDIVHRSGHDKNGVAITLTVAEINSLCDEIEKFAQSIDQQLSSRI